MTTPVKRCTKCGNTKPTDAFHRNKRMRGGLHTWCKDCVAAYHDAHRDRKLATTAAWKAANKDRARMTARKWELRHKYGITLEQYDEMLRRQRGVCAICGNQQGKANNGTQAKLAVDHDHVTGVIRGLLCSECNTFLGKARENPVILREAARYLETPRLRVVGLGDG